MHIFVTVTTPFRIRFLNPLTNKQYFNTSQSVTSLPLLAGWSFFHPKQNTESELKEQTCFGTVPSKVSCLSVKGLKRIHFHVCFVESRRYVVCSNREAYALMHCRMTNPVIIMIKLFENHSIFDKHAQCSSLFWSSTMYKYLYISSFSIIFIYVNAD